MHSLETEVAVVGAGIIGMTVALTLARSGKIVHVIERAPTPGAEASGAGAGILSPRLKIERADPFFDLSIDSWRLWTGMSRSLLETTGIDPEHRAQGLLYLASTPDEWEAFLRLRDRQSEMGIIAAIVVPDEIRDRFPNVRADIPGALFYPDEHHLHTSHTLDALHAACRVADVRFVFETEVEGLIPGGREPGGPGRRVTGFRTDRLEVVAEHVVIAAGAWTGELTASLQVPLPVKPVRGQAALANVGDAAPPCLLYSSQGYVVPRAGGEIFAGSTVEEVGFDRNTTEEGIKQIWDAALWMLPGLGGRSPQQQWAGLRPGTRDELPIIGPLPGFRNLWIAAGHYQNGILLAPITAEIIREWITTGDPGRDMSAFLPDRFL